MAHKFSVRERIRQLELAGKTQAEIGARLGVHPRTIRKWKRGADIRNGRMFTVRPTLEHDRALQGAAREARGAVERANRNLSRGRQPIPTGAPVEVLGHRRMLKRYRAGKWTGERYESHWINYPIATLTREEIISLIESLRLKARGRKLVAHLVYVKPRAGPKNDSDTPFEIDENTGRILTVRGGSPEEDLNGMDSPALWHDQHLGPQFGGRRRPLFLAVKDQDRVPVRKRKRKGKRR